MSTRNKTSDKLVASIRKTRDGAAGKPAAGTAGSGTAAAKKAAPRKAAKPATRTTRRPAAKSPRRAAGLAAGAALSPLRDDPYQSGRRIWPD